MEWTEAYATGNDQVDSQHKFLFLMTQQFRENLEAGQGEATYDIFVEFLGFYVKSHFSYEEQCMLAHLCPAAEQNKQEHRAFSLLVQRELARFAQEGFDRPVAYKLLDTIDRWLHSHIGRVDVQLKSVMP